MDTVREGWRDDATGRFYIQCYYATAKAIGLPCRIVWDK